MKVYLAHLSSEGKTYALDIVMEKPFYMLESFNSIAQFQLPLIDTPGALRGFMMDSGAFTVMNDLKRKKTPSPLDVDAYATRYIDFIKAHDVREFLELDMDVVYGLEKVEELRSRLDRETGRKCIPVWHKSRGVEYFKQMCRDYPYVAIGGIVTGEIPKSKLPEVLPWAIRIAHREGAKLHGLGIGDPKIIERYEMDSCDSTSWSTTRFGGTTYQFTGTGIKAIRFKSDRLSNKPVQVRHDITQWLKYSDYIARKTGEI